MQAERYVELHAIDRSRNILRAWRCELGTDLFGAHVVTVRFGRIGTRGRTVEHVAQTGAAVVRLARRGLARRATAERRIGVAYAVRESRGFTLADDGRLLGLDDEAG